MARLTRKNQLTARGVLPHSVLPVACCHDCCGQDVLFHLAAQTWKLSRSLDVFLRKYFLFKPACDLLADLKTFCWILFRLHANISQLYGAALVTIITMTLTSILHWRHKQSALFNDGINMVSSVLWAVGFGLLAYAMKETAPAFLGRVEIW